MELSQTTAARRNRLDGYEVHMRIDKTKDQIRQFESRRDRLSIGLVSRWRRQLHRLRGIQVDVLEKKAIDWRAIDREFTQTENAALLRR